MLHNLRTDHWEKELQAASSDGPCSRRMQLLLRARSACSTDVNGERVNCETRLLDEMAPSVDKAESGTVEDDPELVWDELNGHEICGNIDLDLDAAGSKDRPSSEEGPNYI
jgi:hypothetical protein